MFELSGYVRQLVSSWPLFVGFLSLLLVFYLTIKKMME